MKIGKITQIIKQKNLIFTTYFLLNLNKKTVKNKEVKKVDVETLLNKNKHGFSLEINNNNEKVYLKFQPVKGCNRSAEIRALEKIGVVKMPLVNFPLYDDRNTSVYELLFSIDANIDDIERYFHNNIAVKRLSEKDIDFFNSIDFEPMKRADLKAFQNNRNTDLV